MLSTGKYNSMHIQYNDTHEDEAFSLTDIEFRVKRLANEKEKDIEGYQAEIFKIGGPILIPHIHKLFNLAVKHGFPKTRMTNPHCSYF
jgi:hypothetical protein